MNRLTKKNDKKYFKENIACSEYNDYEQFIKDRPYRIDYLNSEVETKLGKLEDLEEQLGCPLEVLTTNKTAMVIKDEQVYEANIYYINFNGGKIAFGSTWSFTERKIKDYQKTWWLKGEKPNE